MRGVGKGQRLTLFVIPEVVTRLQSTLGTCQTGDLLRDIPAWLLLNSMRIESLQFFKLSVQELANVWRKKALANLLADSIYANEKQFSGYLRSRRFHSQRPAGAPANLPDKKLLQLSIAEFRETIEYVVDGIIAAPPPFLDHLQEMLNARPDVLITGDEHSQQIIHSLFERMKASVKAAHMTHEGNPHSPTGIATAHRMMDLNSEIVHEQEQEEEQEQEAEQEEQRVSAFSRDDEYQIPWKVETLLHCGQDPSTTTQPGHNSPFYQLNSFQLHVPHHGTTSDSVFDKMLNSGAADHNTSLAVGERFLLSDNYFRLRWHGVGERRLKNCFLYIEWIPSKADTANAQPPGKCYGLVTLAEGESLRWLIHHSSKANETVPVALRAVSNGHYMDYTTAFQTAASGDLRKRDTSSDPAGLLFRFFNNDMFFSEKQVGVLEETLQRNTPNTRLQFFLANLRLRRRHRNHWEDSPVAMLFLTPREKPHRRALALLGRLQSAFVDLLQALVHSTVDGRHKNMAVEVETLLGDFTSQLTTAVSKEDPTHFCSVGDKELVPSLPAGELALLLQTCFPKYFQLYSLQDISNALVYAARKVAQTDDKDGRAVYFLTTVQQEGRIPLPLFYQCFPVLDYVALQEYMTSKVTHSASSKKKSKEPWNCPTCTFLNEAGTRVCAVCMSVLNDGGEDSAHPADTPDNTVDGVWSCPSCTFLNESRKQPVCSVCLGPNPNPLEERHSPGVSGNKMLEWDCPEGYWTCSVEHGGCSKYNPNNVFYCTVCEKARPNLSAVRF
ncbi:hypothetical protein, conserved [Angomonas deanei]|uniref:ubiquitinyl hydrolase 1 n=1 Tax=Angomonas deanei TaxID=59799 RepID=A0A7G2C309_9TRYP|nr:hypothetical protein, conserved [Angomonas deanei]